MRNHNYLPQEGMKKGEKKEGRAGGRVEGRGGGRKDMNYPSTWPLASTYAITLTTEFIVRSAVSQGILIATLTSCPYGNYVQFASAVQCYHPDFAVAETHQSV